MDSDLNTVCNTKQKFHLKDDVGEPKTLDLDKISISNIGYAVLNAFIELKKRLSFVQLEQKSGFSVQFFYHRQVI